jgi:hypothetical protein
LYKLQKRERSYAIPTEYPINMATVRSYDIFIPPTPRSALLPAIIIFHGRGQDIRTIHQ